MMTTVEKRCMWNVSKKSVPCHFHDSFLIFHFSCSLTFFYRLFLFFLSFSLLLFLFFVFRRGDFSSFLLHTRILFSPTTLFERLCSFLFLVIFFVVSCFHFCGFCPNCPCLVHWRWLASTARRSLKNSMGVCTNSQSAQCVHQDVWWRLRRTRLALWV